TDGSAFASALELQCAPAPGGIRLSPARCTTRTGRRTCPFRRVQQVVRLGVGGVRVAALQQQPLRLAALFARADQGPGALELVSAEPEVEPAGGDRLQR